jgi:hypothetical protein
MKNKSEEESELVECLLQQGFTRGLAHNVYRHSKEAFALRIWVLDNSGSMIQYDGRKLVETKKRNHIKWAVCSRWEELKECVHYHAQMAGLLQAPTKFLLLNAQSGRNLEQSFGVGELGPDMVEEELESLFHTLSDTHPSGVTPLARHLRDIYQMILPMRDELRREGQQVVVCLATDGLPTDERGYTGERITADFERHLKKLLHDLPVWMVVRLCTDEEPILAYYEKLDSQLELNLEVLDDFRDEAKEVHGYNPWLVYGLPLHRCREMGFHHRLLDLLDERKFTLDEICDFLRLLFGNSAIQTDPHADWDAFMSEVKKLIATEDRTYNSVRKRITPWINVWRLEWMYGPMGRKVTFWLASLFFIMLAIIVQRCL